MKYLIGVLVFFLLLGFSIAGAADLTVEINGPEVGDEKFLLPDTLYTFIVNVTYTGSFDISASGSNPTTLLTLSIQGGSFQSPAGTRDTHFSVTPQQGAYPAVFQDNTGFQSQTTRCAVATVKTDQSGTFQFRATVQVDGKYLSIFHYADVAEAVPYQNTIQEPGAMDHYESLFKDLAWSRWSMAQRYLQMYSNYMNSGNYYGQGDNPHQALAQDTVDILTSAGRLTGFLGAANLLQAGGPELVLYDSFFGYFEPTSQLIEFTSDLLNTLSNATQKLYYHTSFDDGKTLVKIYDHEEAGLLNLLLRFQADEAWIWYYRATEQTDPDPERPGLLEALQHEQELLLCIEKKARKILLDKVPDEDITARAIFTAIERFAASELEAIRQIRAHAYLFEDDIFYRLTPACFYPADNAPNIDLDPEFRWACADTVSTEITFKLYWKKSSDDAFQEVDIPNGAHYNPATLDAGETYEWYVEAVLDPYVVSDECPTVTVIPPLTHLFDSITTPVRSKLRRFSTVQNNPGATIHSLNAPATVNLDETIQISAGVEVNGMSAELAFQLLDQNDQFIRIIGNPIQLPSGYHPNVSVQFSNIFPIDNAKIKALVRDSSGYVWDTVFGTIDIEPIIYSGVFIPFLVGIQVEASGIHGTPHVYQSNPVTSKYENWNSDEIFAISASQEGSPYLYDSGPINIQFLTWGEDDFSTFQCWMKYTFSENEPLTWAGRQEVELTYIGPIEHTIVGDDGVPYTLTAAKHVFNIPREEFGPLSDGLKKLWIQPTKFKDYLSTISNLEWVFCITDHPIRDDDNNPPLVTFEGFDSGGNPSATTVTPRRSDIFIHIADSLGISPEGAVTDAISGVYETKVGWIVTDNQPYGLDDQDFTYFLTQPFATSFNILGYFDLLPEWETKWLTYRAIAKDADDDWPSNWSPEDDGDWSSTVQDWTAQIPDDDTDGPVITNITHPSSAEASSPVPVTVEISDPSGLKINESSGLAEAHLYYRYKIYGPYNQVFYTSVQNGQTYRFDIPAPGGEHVGDTLYFYIDATDGDNDRPEDAATTIDKNGGQHYQVQIVDTDFPVIQNLNISDGSVVSGNVQISAEVFDPSGYVNVLLLINGQPMSDSLPFVWNTLIPFWSDPVLLDTDGGSVSIAAGTARELWVAYIKVQQSCQQLCQQLYVRHTLDGSNWEEPLLVVGPRDYIFRPALLRDFNGVLWLTYQDYDENFNITLYVHHSADDGQTWSEPVKASNGVDVFGHSFFQDSGGTFWYAFYTYDFSGNTDILIQVIQSENGLDWGPPVTVDPNTDWSLYYVKPAIGESQDGLLHVVYRSYDGLVQATSADGTSWTPRIPMNLAHDPSNTEPGMIIKDHAEYLWLSYYANGYTYLARSKDLVNWDAPVVVGEQLAGIGVAQSGDGTFWVASNMSGNVEVVHSVTAENYTIAIEATDAAGNTTTETVSNVVVNNDPGLVNLNVVSPYGSPQGSGIYEAGSEVTAAVTSPVLSDPGVRKICSGFTGTGSAPATGDSSAVSFTLNTNTTVTFNWQTEVFLTVDTHPSGLSALWASDWYEPGQALDIAAAPEILASDLYDYVFTGWSIDGSPTEDNPPVIILNAPTTLTAHYHLKGDISGDGSISLEDAVFICRILCGITSDQLYLLGDINGDGRIGMTELIYVLQRISE
ncbi:exo-alpha-sialidase [Thermodesulfobacteriota bacterium]